MKKIVIINAYGHSNRGDSVLLQECISELKEAYNNCKIHVLLFEDSEFSDSCNVTSSERLCNPLGDKYWKRTLSKIWLTFVCILSCLFKSHYFSLFFPKAQQKSFLKIKNSDLVISAPGGYIHDTNLAYFIALLHIYLSKKLGKRVLLAPQSIGPINSKIGRVITKFVLSKVDGICAREEFSVKFLNEIGIKSNLIISSGDSAFWNFDVDESKLIENLSTLGVVQDEEFCGITMVDWTFPNLPNPSLLREKYIKTMANLVNQIHHKFGIRSVIFNQVTDDIEIAINVKKICGNSVIVDEIDKEPEHLRALISRSKVFIGTRFHSCIFALMANVPTTAIAYLPKTEFIMKDLSLDDRFMDIALLDEHLLFSKVERDLNDTKTAQYKIENAVKTYRKRRNRLYDVL